MATFRFEHEPVLFQRRTEEDHCQRELAKALRSRMILMDQLRRMQENISLSKRQLGDGLVGRVDVDQVSHFARYGGQVTQRAHEFVSKLAAVERQVTAARGSLAEATRARKSLESLRQKRYDQWLSQLHRREQAQLDEFASQRFARRLMLRTAQS